MLARTRQYHSSSGTNTLVSLGRHINSGGLFVPKRHQTTISNSASSLSAETATAVTTESAADILGDQNISSSNQLIKRFTRNGVPLRMLILGAPGAGKGTQSSRIRNHFAVTTISSGDVLRRNILEQTPAGQQAQSSVARGELVPDNLIVSLIRNELETIQNSNWLLDGFPRNLAQAQALDQMLLATDQPLNAVVNLNVPEHVILNRIIERYVHVPSGRVYNLTYNPPKVPGVDDITGEPLEHRPDDNPESFKRRLQQYHALTEPLLEYYGKAGVLASFAGDTSDIIFPQLKEFLDERFE
ncbi:Adenylate kinase 2 [Kickxella alabastrina]|uniref:Adenylate kinase 2 n=1 Tax=Kickxella alabastrina TaxID=61397 RepID=A0ACC1I8V8_9FUNG|nr:Adenylate kinase 2 [Kickxella alabastrina]